MLYLVLLLSSLASSLGLCLVRANSNYQMRERKCMIGHIKKLGAEL